MNMEVDTNCFRSADHFPTIDHSVIFIFINFFVINYILKFNLILETQKGQFFNVNMFQFTFSKSFIQSIFDKNVYIQKDSKVRIKVHS